MVEEDKRLKLPANWEAKKARLEWELKVEEKKKVSTHLQLPVTPLSLRPSARSDAEPRFAVGRRFWELTRMLPPKNPSPD